MTLATGTRLGAYEVISPLGAGGMGEVYRARDTRLDREVAVKVLSDHLAADATALSRFEREAKAVAALSHPNILAIHDFSREGATSWQRQQGDAVPRRVEVAGLRPLFCARVVGLGARDRLKAVCVGQL